jgi:hypothetical protein
MNILFPHNYNIERLKALSADVPFSDEVIDLLGELSVKLLSNPLAKQYPDVVTFAFYCRKSNLRKLKRESANAEELRIGKGIVFHISPSNVPVNFAYSLISGLLAGNINIVRLPSKGFEQVDIIISELIELYQSSKHKEILDKIVLVKYDRTSDDTTSLSAIANMRIIWGGDETIADIRKSPLAARATEITFADRYSLCIINAENYLNEDNPKKVANDFYNDTFLMDQNACTSPHLVVWKGINKIVEEAQRRFWSELHILVKQKYELQSLMAVDKLNTLYTQAINYGDIIKQESKDNLIWRVGIYSLKANLDEFRCNSGYFAEYSTQNINEVATLIDEKYQTLAYFGFDHVELKSFVVNNKLKGIDRIVPIGRTLDFSMTWDGYDLIKSMSRCIEIS